MNAEKVIKQEIPIEGFYKIICYGNHITLCLHRILLVLTLKASKYESLQSILANFLL